MGGTGYQRTPVPGSDGASLIVLNSSYAKDKSFVYYSFTERSETNVAAVPRSVRVDGANAATLEVAPAADGGADAKDAQGRYKEGKRLNP